jgi:hypothetical protein
MSLPRDRLPVEGLTVEDVMQRGASPAPEVSAPAPTALEELELRRRELEIKRQELDVRACEAGPNPTLKP